MQFFSSNGRRGLTRLTLAMALALATIAPAWATAPTDADVNRLLSASRAQSMTDAMFPQLEAMQLQQFEKYAAQRKLTAEDRDQLKRMQERTIRIFREEMSWQKMRPLYLDLYKKTFSKEDILAMAEFYESSAGQSMLDKTPALIQNVMIAIQARLEPLMARLDQELQEIVNEQPSSRQPPVVDVPAPRPTDIVR